MDFENKYPYTDFHELNLDWILNQMKALAAAWDAYQEQLTGTNGEWPTFKNYIETSWATYQANLTGPTGEWPTFKAAMELAWQQYQNSLTGVGGEWPTFKATMEGEWQQFFDTYLQTLGVVQVTGQSVTDVMSQKATTDTIVATKTELMDKIDGLFEPGLNKCNPDTLVDGYLEATGDISLNLSYKTTEFIDVSNFTNAYAIGKAFRKFLAYDASYNVIADSYIDVDSPASVVPLDPDYKYIRVTFYSSNLNNLMISDTPALVAYEPYHLHAKDGIDYGNTDTKTSVHDYIKNSTEYIGKNKLNPNTLVGGYLEANGVVTPNASYTTTDFIDVSNFQYGYAISVNFRKFLAYDQYKNYIAASYINTDSPAGVVALNSSYKYVRITLYVSNMTDPQLADSATQTDYEPYDLKIIDGVNYLNTETERAVQALIPTVEHNMLYGKKWYACGDSFTQGDFTGLVDGYTFTDQPYMGQMKVYPFFIGRRAGMDVVNMAVGGMTMAHIEGRNNDFCTSVYQNVGADADYITLKFGINDNNQSVPIGTIDDNVDTTFYGAWNKVLAWLIENRPTAKIGIIVTNGLSSNDYAVATIAIANKYGLPYLNEWSGEQVPVLIRSGRTDVLNSIKNIRYLTFRVTESNSHPNVACHEYESTFVETWLKTL